jgi:hypothetical protein
MRATIEGSIMADLWLFARLHGAADPAPVLPAAMLRLARYLRWADQQACLFFNRTKDSQGIAFDLWLSSSRRVRQEAEAQLRAGTRARWQLWTDDGVTRPIRHRHQSGRDVTDELAAVSSQLALTMPSAGAMSPDFAFSHAVIHLRAIAAEVPDNGRSAFLFRCWQQWCPGLCARDRVGLAADSALRAGAIPDEPSAAQRTYVRGTREVIGRQRADGLPARYLWFAQAAATHDRLAIPVAAGAAAALTVRRELSADLAPMPVLVSGAVR